MIGILVMGAGGALGPAGSGSGGGEGFECRDVAPKRRGLFERRVGPEGGARVAGGCEALGIFLREAVDLVGAAVTRAGGAMLPALGRQFEFQGAEVVDDDPVMRGDRGAGAGREAGFDLFRGGAEVGDQRGGRGGHGSGLSGELHRFGTMTIALKRQMS
ncbi:hypothetical protein DD557_07740 [Thalassobacter stenotrophicus]|nr:hypothetical protein DD557_07740 [Thalassobacter stenotrophicus]